LKRPAGNVTWRQRPQRSQNLRSTIATLLWRMKAAASSRVWNIAVSPVDQDTRERQRAEWAEGLMHPRHALLPACRGPGPFPGRREPEPRSGRLWRYGIVTLLKAIGESPGAIGRRRNRCESSPAWMRYFSSGSAPQLSSPRGPSASVEVQEGLGPHRHLVVVARLVQVRGRVVQRVHGEEGLAGGEEPRAGGVRERRPAHLDLVARLLRLRVAK